MSQRPEDADLFRLEAIGHRDRKLDGRVLVIRPVAFQWLSIGVLAALMGVGTFVYVAEYTRTERAVGRLVPASGLVDVYASRIGVVEGTHVREGDLVEAQQALLRIRTENSTEDGRVQQALAQQTLTSLRRAEKRSTRYADLASLERERLSQELAGRTAELNALDDRIQHQRDLVSVRKAALQRSKKLVQRGVAAANSVEERRQAVLEAEANLASLEVQRAQLLTSQRALAVEKRLQQARQWDERDALADTIAELRRELIEIRARASYTVRAPIRGRVATLRTQTGESVMSRSPLLSLLPAETSLIAEIYATSSTRGRLHPGLSVLLKYRAFPPRKHGFFHGVIAEISETTLAPDEFETPGYVVEPVYRVRAEIESQSVPTPEGRVPLWPGMLLDAELVNERRRVIEWLFSPLYDLRDRQAA